MLRRWLRGIGWVVGTLGAVALFVAVVWQIDTRVAQAETVPRNVTVAGMSVGGLGEDDLGRQLELLADDVAAEQALLRTPTREFTATNADIGVTLDVDAVSSAALAARPGSGSVDDFRSWAESFFATTDIEPAYAFDEPTFTTWVEALGDNRIERLPVEPTFTGRDGLIAVTEGVEGLWLVPDDAAAEVAAAAGAGGVPVEVDVPWSPLPPAVGQEQLAEAVAEAEALADRPLTVRVQDTVARIGPGTIRRWIDAEQNGDGIGPVLDTARIQDSLERILSDIRTEGDPPVFTIVDDEVQVELGDPSLKCCSPRAGDIVADAILTDYRGAVALPLIPAQDAASVAADLGIVEVVGEFTTNHQCCQSRVNNIQRMADLVRGVLIAPGESFSINDFIGERTRDNGFVPAGTIIKGRIVDTVGGGVSQFATTMFNASFFAGLDFLDYKAHSLYISRYPYGREATLNFPDVDLEVENNTPYGMLIWTSYTGTSITVQLWSTPYYEVVETGQAVSGWGRACTHVETFRERTTPDGAVLEDSVFAIYRPGEGIDCNGNSIPE